MGVDAHEKAVFASGAFADMYHDVAGKRKVGIS